MTHIILMHGLLNKPEPTKHTSYCIASIQEGLIKNSKQNLLLTSPASDKDSFRIGTHTVRDAYWADLLYKNPLHNDAHYAFDDLYDDEPYVEAGNDELKTFNEGITDLLRKVALDAKDMVTKPLQSLLKSDGALHGAMSRLVRDLALYYDDKAFVFDKFENGPVLARTAMQNRLRRIIEPLLKNNEKVLLIAHSMGTIISYDLLRKLGQENPNYKVDGYFTLGSPLGLDLVQANIEKLPGNNREVRTPSIVQQWINFSDKRDPVCTDCWLSDDYKANRHGITVVDDLVLNSYQHKGNSNHHKIYGYLRCPEFSEYLMQKLKP